MKAQVRITKQMALGEVYEIHCPLDEVDAATAALDARLWTLNQRVMEATEQLQRVPVESMQIVKNILAGLAGITFRDEAVEANGHPRG